MRSKGRGARLPLLSRPRSRAARRRAADIERLRAALPATAVASASSANATSSGSTRARPRSWSTTRARGVLRRVVAPQRKRAAGRATSCSATCRASRTRRGLARRRVKVRPKTLAELDRAGRRANVINSKIAKEVLKRMWADGGSPRRSSSARVSRRRATRCRRAIRRRRSRREPERCRRISRRKNERARFSRRSSDEGFARKGRTATG